MTVPEDMILPYPSERAKQGGDALDQYLRELINSLQMNYRVLSQGVNGDLKNDLLTGSDAWIPTVSGTSSSGAGTYNHQVGWVQRAGIFVDVWFDVSWSAHTGTGNLFLDLPYLVAISNQAPFVGVLQVSNITYTGTYCIINAIPNTRRGELATCSSAAASTNVAMDTAGQIRGHIRYVGQSEERT